MAPGRAPGVALGVLGVSARGVARTEGVELGVARTEGVALGVANTPGAARTEGVAIGVGRTACADAVGLNTAASPAIKQERTKPK